MKINEFYNWFANLPIGERRAQIGTFQDDTYPLLVYDVYKRLKELDDITRVYDIEREKLLSKVDWFISEFSGNENTNTKEEE